MSIDIKPIRDFFPYIDDPANIFYSKLKTYFCSLAPSYLHVKALDRVHRVVHLHLPFTDHVWKVKEDLRNIPSEVYEGLSSHKIYNGYALLTFNKYNKVSSETTTSGEVIPVDEYTLGFSKVDKHLSYYESSEKVLLISDTLNYVCIGLRVSETLMQMGTLVDFLPVDKTQYKENYLSVYKPIIGRKIHFTKGLQDKWSWDLYDIDSNYNETLIDSSSIDDGNNFSCTSCNYSHHWPITYGPSIDHPASLTFCKNSFDPPYEENASEYTITIMEKAFAKDSYTADIRMYNYSDYYIDDRGLGSFDDLKMLFSKLRIGYKKRPYTHSGGYRPLRTFYAEELLLALCFILNINFRFLYSDRLPVNNNDINYFTLHSNHGEIYLKLVNRITTTDGRSINIPTLFPSTPLDQIASVYYGEPFDDSTSTISMGANTVPLVQNTFGYAYRSPFDRFRSTNADLLYYISNALMEYNPYIDNGTIHPSIHIMNWHDYILNSPSLTSSTYLLSSSVLKEISYYD